MSNPSIQMQIQHIQTLLTQLQQQVMYQQCTMQSNALFPTLAVAIDAQINTLNILQQFYMNGLSPQQPQQPWGYPQWQPPFGNPFPQRNQPPFSGQFSRTNSRQQTGHPSKKTKEPIRLTMEDGKDFIQVSQGSTINERLDCKKVGEMEELANFLKDHLETNDQINNYEETFVFLPGQISNYCTVGKTKAGELFLIPEGFRTASENHYFLPLQVK